MTVGTSYDLTRFPAKVNIFQRCLTTDAAARSACGCNTNRRFLSAYRRLISAILHPALLASILWPLVGTWSGNASSLRINSGSSTAQRNACVSRARTAPDMACPRCATLTANINRPSPVPPSGRWQPGRAPCPARPPRERHQRAFPNVLLLLHCTPTATIRRFVRC
jgi:hypothetical protein